MSSATLLRDHRTSIASISALAESDIATLLREVTSADQARDALLDVMPALVDAYGSASASVGADFYDELRDAASPRGRFRAVTAEPFPPEQVEAVARWAAGPMYQAEPDIGATLERAQQGVQRLVANSDRLTVQRSALLDPSRPRFSRVASASACEFCRMLAGRGAVYRTEESAGSQSSFHGHCHCIVAPSWGGAVVPKTLPPEPTLTPEPEFVQRIYGQLVSGELTPAELRRLAATSDRLGQVNADEALRLHATHLAEQSQAVAASTKKVAAASPKRAQTALPEGSVAQKVDFSQEVLDALVPKGGWTTTTRAKTVATLKSTPEGRQLLKTMDSFQSGGSTAIPRLRTDIEKYLSGDVGDMPKGRIDAIENFLSAVGRSDAGDRNLFRGMSIPGDIEEVAARYRPGDDLDLSLASFSTDKKLAQDFTLKGAGKKVRGATRTPVFVEWVGGGKRALPIEKLSKSRVFANEKEWVGAGRYTIEGTRRVKVRGVETVVVTIRQKATW